VKSRCLSLLYQVFVSVSLVSVCMWVLFIEQDGDIVVRLVHSVRKLMFVDPCIIVQFIKKNPTRCNNVSKFYYSIFICSSACFGRHTAHHQEPKTAMAASGFAYVEGCWTCSWWMLSGTLCLTTSTNYTSNNLPRMKNQRLPLQF